ncbi:MAG: vitamin K epoxide reductase family protein [Actinomycetia bacterium]|nr:vitamin K epoxide reductase family protein [Actinomycetes bacterium]
MRLGRPRRGAAESGPSPVGPKSASARLLCDINGRFSCANALTFWQSSVFGPIPNAAIGLSVFALTLGVAGAGRWARLLPRQYGVPPPSLPVSWRRSRCGSSRRPPL